jgi:microsomal dipeptidase-like Zn-dependent dipeptidase
MPERSRWTHCVSRARVESGLTTKRGSIGLRPTERTHAARLPTLGCALLAVVGILVTTGAATSFGSKPRGSEAVPLRPLTKLSRFALANHCWTMSSRRSQGFLQPLRIRYRQGRSRANAARFYLKPTRLGAYLIYDEGRKLMTASSRSSVSRLGHVGKRAVWAVKRARSGGFHIVSVVNGRRLAVIRDSRLELSGGKRSGRATEFEFAPAHGCKRYPEARTGARGRPFKGTRPNGSVKGFADAHLHITAEVRAGGQVIYGRSFAPLGITRALSAKGDARVHGPDGSADITGNLLRSGTPFGTHDTHGWPTFAGWPTFDTITHQQTYYVWLKRMWKAGMRLVVAQTVEDEPLCQLEPERSHSCDETHAIKLEIKRLKGLQSYVDAQAGGPGRGWFRIVRNPRQARRVIKQGKLAVLIGIESSNLFGCSESKGEPQCDRADIDRGIRDYKRLGVRTMFVAHWVDNALSGAALEGGSKGGFINVLEALQTGHYFDTAPCPEKGQGEEVTPLSLGILKFLQDFFPPAGRVLGIPIPSYPAGKQCNAKGLTKLGRYAIRRLMANHMLIEMDHMSERARLAVLKMAEKRDYPLVSSHTNTGGFWTNSDLRRLYALNGFATARPDEAPALADRIVTLCGFHGGNRGVGLGTDTGGFSSLPGPPDASQGSVKYPFKLGGVKFTPERTGKRTFDFNKDGVAQYGQLADLLADVGRQQGGTRATRSLFHSAQAYLDTWRAAFRHG